MNKKIICGVTIGILIGSCIGAYADTAPILKLVKDKTTIKAAGRRNREEFIYVDSDTGVEYFVLMGDNGAMTMTVRVNKDGTPKIHDKWKGEN